MRVYGLWHGGADYAMPYIDNENLEVFPSLGAAKAALRERWDTGGCSSATTADALRAEHLWLASTGQYDHVASGEHSREVVSGKPCTLLGPRKAYRRVVGA